MEGARGRRYARAIGNPVQYDLHRATTGNRGAVGGATSLIQVMYKGEKVQSKGKEEEGVVAPRGDGKATLGHPGRIAGS